MLNLYFKSKFPIYFAYGCRFRERSRKRRIGKSKELNCKSCVTSKDQRMKIMLTKIENFFINRLQDKRLTYDEIKLVEVVEQMKTDFLKNWDSLSNWDY